MILKFARNILIEKTRSSRVKKNIFFGFIFKALNISIGFYTVSVTLNCIDSDTYGIWLIITSMIGWLGFFDIGLGNGLRNKFAAAITLGDEKQARQLVTTAYVTIFFICFTANFLLFYLIDHVDLPRLIGISENKIDLGNLRVLVKVVSASFFITLTLNLIGALLNALQKGYITAAIDLISKTLTLFGIIWISKTENVSLLNLSLIYAIVTPGVLLLSSFYFFLILYKRYCPTLDLFDYSKVRDLFSLGLSFFVIQISGILLYQTNNVIISHLIGQDMVTKYNVSLKYFSVLSIAWSIVLAPFWSASTEAWVTKDFKWLSRNVTKLIKAWIVLLILGIVMLALSNRVFAIWINNDFRVPLGLTITMLISILLSAWNGIFSHFFNGTGKLNVQLFFAISTSVINVPLAWYLGRLYGIEGILLSNAILALPTVIVYPIYMRRLFQI
jgi:O-antigen/teichoic acid export membrane protein